MSEAPDVMVWHMSCLATCEDPSQILYSLVQNELDLREVECIVMTKGKAWRTGFCEYGDLFWGWKGGGEVKFLRQLSKNTYFWWMISQLHTFGQPLCRYTFVKLLSLNKLECITINY